MIGVFDSGHGGLTVLQALLARFPRQTFVYLGDHGNAPYGNRPSEEVIALTRAACETLFGLGCRLVVLACNTATCVAARPLQREWLPVSAFARTHNVLGIAAPTVEAATQTPWGVTSPQYPQKYNSDVIAVFGTTRTVSSGVFPEEIRKRCPRITVVQQACPTLAGAIEAGQPEPALEAIVRQSVAALDAQAGGEPPHRAILACTHYPLVEHLFRRHLPRFTRLLSQPEVVADSLEDYLTRHPHFAGVVELGAPRLRLLTTGDPADVSRIARVFWAEVPAFEGITVTAGAE
ncbi:MAG: glutamate racemase [Hyphomicrobiaceae bacterium]